MTRVIPIFAGALALSLGGVAFDEKPRDHTGSAKMQDLGAPPADLSKEDQAYFVALKNCERPQDAAKQTCIERADKERSRM
jgi:hypothetical protein